MFISTEVPVSVMFGDPCPCRSGATKSGGNVTVYQLVPVGVTIPLAEVDPPALTGPRLVGDPQLLPFDTHDPLHSVADTGHTHEYPEQTPPVGGMHAVPAGCGTSAGHDTLAALHDWLVSHTPDAV